MTRYAVTGSTGALGRLVVTALLTRGVAPGDIVAVARKPERAADLADRGVTVREGDYDRPRDTGTRAPGLDTLLLVSGSEPGQRVEQHRAGIDAAVAAGVGRIVYTSVLRADTTELSLAAEHKATEELLAAAGPRITLLRNGWYTENYTRQLGPVLASGELTGSVGRTARVAAAAARVDHAEADAEVLVGSGHEDATYELGGTPFTMAELAEARPPRQAPRSSTATCPLRSTSRCCAVQASTTAARRTSWSGSTRRRLGATWTPRALPSRDSSAVRPPRCSTSPVRGSPPSATPDLSVATPRGCACCGTPDAPR